MQISMISHVTVIATTTCTAEDAFINRNAASNEQVLFKNCCYIPLKMDEAGAVVGSSAAGVSASAGN